MISSYIISSCKSHLQLCPLKTASVKTSWELYCFYQCFPQYTLCNCMSLGETRQTQSTIFFNTKTKDTEYHNSRIPSKRKQDELTPTMLVEQTSTEEDNEIIHCSWQLWSTDKNKEQIVIKLNQLKDRVVRCKLHKDFLIQRMLKTLFQRVWNLNWNPQLTIMTKNLLTCGTQSWIWHSLHLSLHVS